MEFSNLIYRGHKSGEFGLAVKFPFKLVHPTADLTATHINGRNGDFLLSENSYQNVTEQFDVLITRPLSKYKTQFNLEAALTSWLEGNDYSYLKFDFFPGYCLEAVVKDAYSIDWTDFINATGSISFYCKPFWKRTDGINYLPAKNGLIFNSEKAAAIPDWHFNAQGSFTLTVNDFPYIFKDIEGEVWLDGQEGNAWTIDENGNQILVNDQLQLANNTTPQLNSGQNDIELTMDAGAIVSTFEYRPNWRRLI